MKIERIIFGVIIALSMGVYAYAESCSSKGQVQYKYTASGCSYTTQSRTCCSNGSWSDWGADCPPDCNSNEIYDSSKKQCCTIDPVSRAHAFTMTDYIAQHNACMSMGKGLEQYACSSSSSTGCCRKRYSSTFWLTDVNNYTSSGHGLAISASRGGSYCTIDCDWVPKCRSI